MQDRISVMSASFDDPRGDPVLSVLLKNLGGLGWSGGCIGFDLFSLLERKEGQDVLCGKQVSFAGHRTCSDFNVNTHRQEEALQMLLSRPPNIPGDRSH